MNDNRSPEDILDAVLNRAPDSSPAPVCPPKLDPPREDIPPPPSEAAEKAGGTDWTARLLPWLCLVLGCALLVLGIGVLQVIRINDRLEELQLAVEQVQLVDSLQAENDTLHQKTDEMQERIDSLEQEIDDTAADAYNDMERNSIRRAEMEFRMKQYGTLSFLQQFIDHGDLPMAAIVMMLEDESLHGGPEWFTGDFPELNSLQQEQYDSFREILVEAGLLKEQIDPAYGYMSSRIPTTLAWTEEWDLEHNPDMAALGILWYVLYQHYINGMSGVAAQVLLNYQFTPLGDPGKPYPQRAADAASDYTIRLYEQMIDDLIEREILVEEDGFLAYPPDLGQTDVLYVLPFSLDDVVNTAGILLNGQPE